MSMLQPKAGVSAGGVSWNICGRTQASTDARGGEPVDSRLISGGSIALNTAGEALFEFIMGPSHR